MCSPGDTLPTIIREAAVMEERNGMVERRAPREENGTKTKLAAAAAVGALITGVVMQYLLPDVRDIGRKSAENTVTILSLKDSLERNLDRLERSVESNTMKLNEGGRHTEEEAVLLWDRHIAQHGRESAEVAGRIGVLEGKLDIIISLLAEKQAGQPARPPR